MDPDGKAPLMKVIRNPDCMPQWVVCWYSSGHLRSAWYPQKRDAYQHHAEYLSKGTARLLRVKLEAVKDYRP